MYAVIRPPFWSLTQGVWYQRTTAAMILGIKPDNVHVIFRARFGLLRAEWRGRG